MSLCLRAMVMKELAGDLNDGLYNTELNCACVIVNLMPCGEPSPTNCYPGVIMPNDNEDFDFMIGERE